MSSRFHNLHVLPAALMALAATVLPSVGAEANEWKLEVVDSRGPGRFSSMKVDKSGNVHLAYVLTTTENTLQYAFWDARIQRWFMMTIAKGSGVCSLVLDSRQRPHISFVDAGSGSGAKLRYAFWDGTKWQVQAIPLNSDIIAYYNSIALDQQDRPSISFYEYRGPAGTDISIRMRVVSWNGTHWEVRTVDQEPGSGKFNSLACDSKGGLHLAYANVSVGSMRYAYWDGKSWIREDVDTPPMNDGAYVGYSAFITIDATDTPHITYMNQSQSVLKYAVRSNGKWQVQAVDVLAGTAYPDRNSALVDSNGRPYITYYDAGRGALKMAHRQGDHWSIHIVDVGVAGFTSALQIVGDQLWISYTDESNQCVKVARTDLTRLHISPRASDAGEEPRVSRVQE